MRNFKLTPLDTLFFRDGSPFTAGETGQMEVKGVFPSSPTTVVGALRAAFARELGWEGGAWKPDIIAKLGDGDDLAPLSFSGPHLWRDGKLLFPAPLHLMKATVKDGDKKKEVFTFLRPSDKTLDTDIGPVRLPEPKDEETKGFKLLEGAYLTLRGMQTVLNDERPNIDDIVQAKDLWQSETRTGIQRDDASHTTKENALYQTAHVRLAKGVSLVMGVDGYDGGAPELLILGGESRMAGIEELEDTSKIELPDPPSLASNRYTVTLITPAHFSDDGWRTPNGNLSGLPGKVVSACVGKPVMIGGWDSEARKPKPLEPHLPAGSTWFMEANESDQQTVLDMHGKHIGNKTEWGYGQILIGAW